MQLVSKGQAKTESKGAVYCYLCTHTVEAETIVVGRNARVKPGQKCPRCSAPLDAGYVLRFSEAA